MWTNTVFSCLQTSTKSLDNDDIQVAREALEVSYSIAYYTLLLYLILKNSSF